MSKNDFPRTVLFGSALSTFGLCAVLLTLPLLMVSCTGGGEKEEAPQVAAPTGELPSHTVSFDLADASNVGALQIDISYAGAEGAFLGEAAEVECETGPVGILSSFNHISSEKMLRAAFVAVEGIQGPTRLVACKYQGAVTATDFKVDVRDASSPETDTLNPLPGVNVVVD